MAEEFLEGDGTEEDSAPEGNTALTADEESVSEAAAKAVEKEAAKDGGADHDTDEKSEDSKADEDKDGAPATYADFKLPEGMDMDQEALEAAMPLFKEMKASQETAQKVVNVASQMVEKVLAKQQTAWTDRVAEWTKDAENDDEYGKASYDKSIMIARSAMRTVGGPNLAKALEETGTGNHPELIRVFYRLGKAIGEDGLDFGSVNSGGQKSLADRLFPNQGGKAA